MSNPGHSGPFDVKLAGIGVEKRELLFGNRKPTICDPSAPDTG